MSKTQKYEVEKELAVVKKMGGESIFDILRTSFFFVRDTMIVEA